jgi:hypothetical protein
MHKLPSKLCPCWLQVYFADSVAADANCTAALFNAAEALLDTFVVAFRVNATITDGLAVSDGTREALGSGDNGQLSCTKRCGSWFNLICLYWKGCNKELATVLVLCALVPTLGAAPLQRLCFKHPSNPAYSSASCVRAWHVHLAYLKYCIPAACCGCQALQRGYCMRLCLGGCPGGIAQPQARSQHDREPRGTYIVSRSGRSRHRDMASRPIPADRVDNSCPHKPNRSSRQHRPSQEHPHGLGSRRAKEDSKHRSASRHHRSRSPKRSERTDHQGSRSRSRPRKNESPVGQKEPPDFMV